MESRLLWLSGWQVAKSNEMYAGTTTATSIGQVCVSKVEGQIRTARKEYRMILKLQMTQIQHQATECRSIKTAGYGHSAASMHVVPLD